MYRSDYRKLGSALLLFFCFGLGFAYGQSPDTGKTKSAGANYRIGIGDVINLAVTQQQLLSRNGIRVSNSGTIRIPMIDEDILAACQTEVELSRIIAGKYKKYLLDPQVNVAVAEFNSNPVAVIGAVNAPGRFDLRRPVRLLEMLTFVNGPAANAGETIQILSNGRNASCVGNEFVLKSGPPKQELVTLSLNETLNGDVDSNPFVSAGDIITVSKAEMIQKAYIVGNVGRAAAIELREPTTLTMAIAIAGGVTRGAKISKITIARQDPKTLAKTRITVNLKEINKGNAADPVLQPNDVVSIPGPTGAKKFLSDIFRVLVPSVTRGIVPVY